MRLQPHPLFPSLFVLFLRTNYQGTILRSPFFFLLLDSFLGSLLLCESPVFAASVASLFASVPAAAALPLGGNQAKDGSKESSGP